MLGSSPRITFVMEQHLGHATYAENLRAALAHQRDLEQTWVEIRYAASAAPWERIGGLPEGVRGALRGRSEVLAGWRPDADVSFFNTQVPAVLGGRTVRRAPYVTAVDITPKQYDERGCVYGHRPDGLGPVKAYKHHANSRLFRQASVVVPWSTWARNSLIDDYGVDPVKVRVIPPGVDTDRWRPGPERRRSGPLRILFVGGDFQRKGGNDLLSAFRSLSGGAAELVLVTKSPVPRERDVRVVDDLEPNSAELLDLYRSSDLFVLPSRAEAFGIAAVEASATGLPVVASRTGGLTDIVDDGESGLLVDPGDVEGLAGALRRLVEDDLLRRRLAAGARRRATAHFDASHNGRKILDVLMEVIAA